MFPCDTCIPLSNYYISPLLFAEYFRPPTSDAFKRPQSRPRSQQNITPKPAPATEQAVLRLTTSAHGKRSPSVAPPAQLAGPQEPSQNTF